MFSQAKKRKRWREMNRDPEIYRKDGKPRTTIICYRCKKKTMKLYYLDKSFISGDGAFYECTRKGCGANYKHIV